jgi:hypothetical protein
MWPGRRLTLGHIHSARTKPRQVEAKDNSLNCFNSVLKWILQPSCLRPCLCLEARIFNVGAANNFHNVIDKPHTSSTKFPARAFIPESDSMLATAKLGITPNNPQTNSIY